MSKHLVLGAGPVGRHTAAELRRRGEEVVVGSRSGRGAGPGVAMVALDATDADAISRAADGVASIHNCLNPPQYHRWPQDWPPMAQALLVAAERCGAVLVTASNLYAYGPVDGPMREGMPDAATHSKGMVRARMWAEALAAHTAGRVHAVEVRASDYVGSGVGAGSHLNRLVPGMLQGRTARVIGDADAAHTWTDVGDVGRTMAHLALTPASWGRVWHAPSNPPRTQREALTDICAAAGRPAPKVAVIPRSVLRALGLVVPIVRELNGVAYQFDRPFVMDSSAAERDLGLA
ncbi:MAG TPA: NAD-dependent epimerase/dehydratase family protein, partial [Candidatus Lustribacter sp.]|nr:NAD-dependent epimerase/dehydratase family protein [Candidatus Lustribacter sp.]